MIINNNNNMKPVKSSGVNCFNWLKKVMFCKGCGSPGSTQGTGYVSPNEFVNSPHLWRNTHLFVTDSHFKLNQFVNHHFQLISIKKKYIFFKNSK